GAGRDTYSAIMNYPGSSPLVQHPPAVCGWPTARHMPHRQPEKAAEMLAGTHDALRPRRCSREPLECLGRWKCRGGGVNTERVMRHGCPELISLGPGVRERATIDEQLRAAKAQGHRQCIRMAMTAAQRAVRSGIDHTDSSARVPSVTKDGETAARKIHIE